MVAGSVSFNADSVGLDAADAGAVAVRGDLDVALVTPGGAPSVLQDIVIRAAFATVTNGEHQVIKTRAARRVIENATGVHLEGGFVGLDGDDNWTSSDGSLERHLAVLLDGHDLFEVHSSSGNVDLARASADGIVRFLLQRVLLEALECVIQEGTTRALAAVLCLSH